RQIVFVLEAGDVLGHDGRALRWRAADGSGERDALVSAPRAAAPAGADPPWAGRDARDDRTLLLTWAIAGSLAIVPPRARTGDRRRKALGAPREPRGRTAAQRAVWDRCGQCAKTRTRRSASPHLRWPPPLTLAPSVSRHLYRAICIEAVRGGPVRGLCGSRPG